MLPQASTVRISGDAGFLARGFENRSGRIIALTRLLLAAVFFLALWLDPNQPVRSSTAGYAILFAYLIFGVAMHSVAWRSWWWDHRLAWPAHFVDVLAFLAAVYFTESADDDFTSPFLAFFAYLMLAATIRWGWRMTVATGVLATVLYLLVGLAMQRLLIDFDTYRFGRRVVYMAVLTMILTWLGHQRRGQIVERFVEPPGASDDQLPPMVDALRYAMNQSGAERGAIAWANDEEPQIELRTIGLGCDAGRISPNVLPPEAPLPAGARLFDSQRNRALSIDERGRCISILAPIDDALAEYCGVREGLALPFEAVTGRGEVLLAGIPGACADHVAVGEAIAREIGAGFDRQATLALVRESAVTRMRDAVARDLHDTIAQSLAGAAMRLEGLRTWIACGGDPQEEIQSIKSALKGEQTQVRALIDRLRRGESVLPDTAAQATIGPLLNDLASYWGIDAGLAPGSGKVPVPGWLAHELRQLVREGVANAVRHGDAGTVTVGIEQGGSALQVTIADDGGGIDGAFEGRQPRSISERISQLGGELDIDSGEGGTTLRFWLPLEANR